MLIEQRSLFCEICDCDIVEKDIYTHNKKIEHILNKKSYTPTFYSTKYNINVYCEHCNNKYNFNYFYNHLSTKKHKERSFVKDPKTS